MEDQQRENELDDQSALCDRPGSPVDDPVGGAPDDLYARLTPKQQKGILALVTEPTIAKAAEQAGVSESTVYRWLQDETFLKAYRRARRDSFSQALTLTLRYAPLAVNALAKIINDLSIAASARVSASCAILKYGRDSIELDDLAARLDNLERATQSADHGRGWRGGR
jgi:hypothetical protein